MNALSPRHEALFDQLNCAVAEMISVPRLVEILNKRLAMHDIILDDRTATDIDIRIALAAKAELRAIKADIDAILGRR